MAIECKGLKHLGLFEYVHEIDVLTISSFQQIESLFLSCDFHNFDPIDLPIEQLPNLRHLSLKMGNYNDYVNVLPLFQKCESLHQITKSFEIDDAIYPKGFITADFFKDFIETITTTRKSNLRMEFKLRDGIIGIATANGIIWRNNLMYWMDYNKNDTNIGLLDLADQINAAAADQTNLLDKICDYLDVGSLAALADVDERSNRLVNNYVDNHLKKHGTFTFTDEFLTFDQLITGNIYKKLTLARLIADFGLNLCIWDERTQILIQNRSEFQKYFSL